MYFPEHLEDQSKDLVNSQKMDAIVILQIIVFDIHFCFFLKALQICFWQKLESTLSSRSTQ